MIRFDAFLPGDLTQLELQGAQSEAQPLLADGDYTAMLAVEGLAWTCRAGPATVACGGVLPQWPGRALGWFLIGQVPDPAWIPIIRRARATIAEAQGRGTRRIEGTVQVDFHRGHRFITLLGAFKPEGVMERYSPEGRDHVLYALIAPAAALEEAA